MIGRFAGVDPIAAQFPHVSVFNYAENEPVGHIDLWGLQKYWAANGNFLKQVGNDNTMRILTVSEGDANSNGEYLFHNSQPIYPLNNENEEMLLKKWANKYQNSSQEFGMSLFTGWVQKENGWGFFKVVAEGSTVTEGEKSRVAIDESTGLSGWKRYTSIHTHPFGDYKNFSNESEGFLTGGDIQWAMSNNIKLYLVPPHGGNMDLLTH